MKKILFLFLLGLSFYLYYQNDPAARAAHREAKIVPVSNLVVYTHDKIDRAVIIAEDGVTPENMSQIIMLFDTHWEKNSSFIGLDQCRVVIHVYREYVNIEVFSEWKHALAANVDDIHAENAPTIVRSAALHVIDTDLLLGNSGDGYEAVEKAISAFINTSSDLPRSIDMSIGKKLLTNHPDSTTKDIL